MMTLRVLACAAGIWSCHLLKEEQVEKEGEEAGILDGLYLRYLFSGDYEYAVIYSRLEFREEIWAVPAFSPFFLLLCLSFSY